MKIKSIAASFILAIVILLASSSPANAQYTWPYIFGPNPTTCSPQYCYNSYNCPYGWYCGTYVFGSQSCSYPHNINLNVGTELTASGCPFQTYLLTYIVGSVMSEYYNYNPYTGVTGWIVPQSLVNTSVFFESVGGNLFDLWTGYAWEDCYSGVPQEYDTGTKPCNPT